MTLTCEYCGQAFMDATAKKEGWELCRCAEAMDRQRREAAIENAKEGALRIFGEEAAEIDFEPLDEISIATIVRLIEDVGDGRLRQVAAGLPHGGTVTIKWDGTDIKLIRKEQRKATA